MDRFERKFGRYAINNLPLILILCYGVGYIIKFINVNFLNYLTLNPYAIAHGQVWRILTWIIVPPNESNIFFVLIMLYFYYSIGTSLERTWGTYKYNVYMLSGILFTVIGAFALMAYCYIFDRTAIAVLTPDAYFSQVALFFSTYYINMSIFLAYAATFPNAVVLLFFVIPVKVKWLGIAYGVLIGIQFISGSVYSKFAILASLLNFLVFWLLSLKRSGRTPVRMKKQQEFNRDYSRSGKIVTRHKCAICGRTEQDSPNMQFRFCSKCDGNYEYCELHIYTHTHVRNS